MPGRARQRLRLREKAPRRTRGGSLRPRRPRYHLLALLAALAMTIGLAFNGLNSLAGGAVACILSCTLLAGLVVARPPSVEEWRHCAVIVRPVGLAMLWLLVSQAGLWTLLGAVGPFAPDLFLPGFIGIAGSLCAFLCGTFIAVERRQFEQTVDLLILLMMLFLVIGLILMNFETRSVFDYWAVERQGRFSGTIGNINTTACLCGILLLLSIGKAAEALAPKRDERGVRDAAGLIMYGSAIIVALFAGLATAARLPILATILLTLLLLVRLVRKQAKLSSAQRWLLAFVILVGGLALIFGSGAVAHRLNDTDSALGTRGLILSHYLDVAMQAPLFGFGPASFSSVNSYYLGTLDDMRELNILNSPHNVILQLLLVGGIPYAALIGCAAWRMARAWIVRERAGQVSRVELGVAAGLILTLLCASIDIVLDVPATVNLTMFLAGMLYGCRSADRSAKPANLRAIPA